MVKEEVNDFNKKNTGKMTGILAAFKAMFLSDDEKIEADVQGEVDKLNNESAGSISNLEKRILSDKEQRRSKLASDLKPKKINPVEKGKEKPKAKEIDEIEK